MSIIPGESATVSIVLLPHWSAAGDERTIQRDITLEIPEDFPAGEANINVSGSSFGFFGFEGFGPPIDGVPDFAIAPDFGVGGFGAEEEQPTPKNLDELIKQMLEAQVDPGLITVTLIPSFGGDFPGLPPDLLPGDIPLPEDFLPPIDGEIPEDGEEGDNGNGDGEMPEDGEMPADGEDGGNGDAEIPPDLQLPEGFPPLDGLPFPEDIGPPPTVEAELIIDGFIVTGYKDITVTITGEDNEDDEKPPLFP